MAAFPNWTKYQSTTKKTAQNNKKHNNKVKALKQGLITSLLKSNTYRMCMDKPYSQQGSAARLLKSSHLETLRVCVPIEEGSGAMLNLVSLPSLRL